MKFHFRRAVSLNTYHHEQLTTILAQIEACLNYRPITAESNDPSDLIAKTPAQFLIGESLKAIPEPYLNLIPVKKLSLWQQMLRHFWDRLYTDYPEELQTRAKSRCKSADIPLGTLVIIREGTPLLSPATRQSRRCSSGSRRSRPDGHALYRQGGDEEVDTAIMSTSSGRGSH
jgi:hypothetical protein